MPCQVPLSIQQEWLWTLLERCADWNCTLATGYRLRGTLDIDILQRSIAAIVRDHSILRTRFVTNGGIAMQQVVDPAMDMLEHIRIDGTTRMEAEQRAARIYEDFSALQFDVTREPPVKFRLLELPGREYWLLLAIHRMLVDCASADQILSHLWPVYVDSLQGRLAASSATAQYGDYARTQRQTNQAWSEKHGAYWQRRLAGCVPLYWPNSERIAGLAPGKLGRMRKIFGVELSTSLRSLARRARSLPGTVALAVYVAVLWGWCRQLDFVLPFNVAGRQAEHRSIIGFFSHILYLRIELSGTESFTELLRRVSNEFYQALSHQDFGLSATRNPELLGGTFAQWVSWHPDAGPTPVPPDLTVERLDVRDFAEDLTAIPPGMVDVEVSFFDAKDGIHALGVYRADRFSAATMERFMADLYEAAGQFVRDPGASIALSSSPDPI
jgi:hypothetical protein